MFYDSVLLHTGASPSSSALSSLAWYCAPYPLAGGFEGWLCANCRGNLGLSIIYMYSYVFYYRDFITIPIWFKLQNTDWYFNEYIQKCTFFILAQASLMHRETAMGTVDFKVLSYLAVWMKASVVWKTVYKIICTAWAYFSLKYMSMQTYEYSLIDKWRICGKGGRQISRQTGYVKLYL